MFDFNFMNSVSDILPSLRSWLHLAKVSSWSRHRASLAKCWAALMRYFCGTAELCSNGSSATFVCNPSILFPWFFFSQFCSVASANLDACADWILHNEIVADPVVLGVPVSIITQVCTKIYFWNSIHFDFWISLCFEGCCWKGGSFEARLYLGDEYAHYTHLSLLHIVWQLSAQWG